MKIFAENKISIARTLIGLVERTTHGRISRFKKLRNLFNQKFRSLNVKTEGMQVAGTIS